MIIYFAVNLGFIIKTNKSRESASPVVDDRPLKMMIQTEKNFSWTLAILCVTTRQSIVISSSFHRAMVSCKVHGRWSASSMDGSLRTHRIPDSMSSAPIYRHYQDTTFYGNFCSRTTNSFSAIRIRASFPFNWEMATELCVRILEMGKTLMVCFKLTWFGHN